MKWLLCSAPMFALFFASCSAPNNAASNPDAPVITRFTPDTAWTFQQITIYGDHFGYDPADIRVTIDTARAQVTSVDDTVMTVNVPEGARTGFIHVATINQSSSSANPVTVEYTFNPHNMDDTVPPGGSFSIPGTGMNDYHGTLHLSVSGIPYPIDSIFPDRVVSHLIAGGTSGDVTIWDSIRAFYPGPLFVTRPSPWKTLSEIWDNVLVTERHQLVTYINGAIYTDSTWQTTAAYSGQHDVNISGINFVTTNRGVSYGITVPSLQLTWDTTTQTASIAFGIQADSTTPSHILDTTWSASATNLPAFLPVDRAIEFVMPNFSYQITEEARTQGVVSWYETTTTTIISGSFDLILKQ
ncbi:MAG TPA: IPT/TIG domain-containing protein [Candidatus Kapabacteria bacterium]|nr:IPT/TIG domain-containing protein [Candidatus Kapabacteria bacterium]